MTQTEQEDEQVEVLVGKDTVLPSASGEALDVEQAAPTHNASTRINAWLFRNHEETRHFGLEELSSLITNDENVVWLDLADFAEDDLRALAGPLQLHESAIRIALDAWQRPRLSAFDGQFFVTVTVPHLEEESRR
nr:hypothetical protein [Chloroflexaceae bacterium]